MEDPDFSQGTPLLTDDEVAELEQMGSTSWREKGHTFMREGEASEFVLLIRKGTVKVVAGEPERIIAFRGPGEIVGEMGVLDREPRSASVVAWDDVEVLNVSDIEWLRFLYRNPRAMHAQLIAANERTKQATRKVVESDFAVERRLAKAFVELADRGLATRSEDTLTVPVVQKDLASLTGASPEAVKKAMGVFRRNGVIETRYRKLYIRDLATIAGVARGNPPASW